MPRRADEPPRSPEPRGPGGGARRVTRGRSSSSPTTDTSSTGSRRRSRRSAAAAPCCSPATTTRSSSATVAEGTADAGRGESCSGRRPAQPRSQARRPARRSGGSQSALPRAQGHGGSNPSCRGRSNVSRRARRRSQRFKRIRGLPRLERSKLLGRERSGDRVSSCDAVCALGRAGRRGIRRIDIPGRTRLTLACAHRTGLPRVLIHATNERGMLMTMPRIQRAFDSELPLLSP